MKILQQINKYELLAKSFAKVDTTENFYNKEKEGRETTSQRNIKILHDQENNEDIINVHFSFFVLNKALKKSGKTIHGKDQIIFCILNNLSDVSQEILIVLYNKIWEERKLPNKWKE